MGMMMLNDYDLASWKARPQFQLSRTLRTQCEGRATATQSMSVAPNTGDVQS